MSRLLSAPVSCVLLFALTGCPDKTLRVGGFCSSEADCPPGQACLAGFCTSTCTTSADCGAGEICIDQLCVPSCSVQADCPGPEGALTCAGGGCVALSEPGYADAGADTEVGEGVEVVLSAEQSVAISTDVTYSWELVASSPKGVTVELTSLDVKGDAVTGKKVRFTTPQVVEDTLLHFELTMRSGGGAESKDQVDVVVKNSVNELPEPSLVVDKNEIAAGDTLELDAAGSSDPNPADGLTFTWTVTTADGEELPGFSVTDEGDGKASLSTPYVEEDTEVVVTVTVSDGEGESERSVTILVRGAKCNPDIATACDDQNPCTDDSCDPAVGCAHAAVTDGDACDDGDACTKGDTCKSGECQPGPPIPCDDALECTTDWCQEGECVFARNGAPCSVEQGCVQPIITVTGGQKVVPQTVLQLSGAESASTGGPATSWAWTVTPPPGVAAPVFDPAADVVSPKLQLNVSGEYVIELETSDVEGSASCTKAKLEVVVIPTVTLHMELTWDTPGDPDQTDTGFEKGADLDLHFLHPKAGGPDIDGDGAPDGWFDYPYDCFWFNAKPTWGKGDGSFEGDPSLARDDTDGAGPENLDFPKPAPDLPYRIGVHYWDDYGFGESKATLRIFIDSKLAYESEPVSLSKLDMWEVGTIEWPSKKVVPAEAPGGGPKIVHDYVNPTFTPP